MQDFTATEKCTLVVDSNFDKVNGVCNVGQPKPGHGAHA